MSARFAAESSNSAGRTTLLVVSMSFKQNRPLRALALAAVLIACLALPAVAGAASYSMKWSRSVPLLNPNDGGGFDSVACAPAVTGNTSLLCVAGDVRGDVFVTAHPAQKAAEWRREYIDPKLAITGISCPSQQLCVAIDSHGQVMHSTDPGSPGSPVPPPHSAWRSTTPPTGRSPSPPTPPGRPAPGRSPRSVPALR
jgi:hypothetical protein